MTLIAKCLVGFWRGTSRPFACSCPHLDVPLSAGNDFNAVFVFPLVFLYYFESVRRWKRNLEIEFCYDGSLANGGVGVLYTSDPATYRWQVGCRKIRGTRWGRGSAAPPAVRSKCMGFCAQVLREALIESKMSIPRTPICVFDAKPCLAVSVTRVFQLLQRHTSRVLLNFETH